MQTFTTIKNLSQVRRFPRLGKIRLGVKAKSKKTGREYPTETEYFVVPPEVAEVFGEKPTELEILLPKENVEDVFPQAYKFYGSQRGVKCIGNGEVARRLVDEKKRTYEEIKCPCELLDQKKCARRASLMFILPKVSMGGIYQIDTTSFNSIVDINSGIDYVRLLIGRVAMVPLKLKRVARQTHYEGHAATHYTLVLHFDGDANSINALMNNTKRVLESVEQLALEAPEDINPELDNGATVEVDDVPEADKQSGPSEKPVPEVDGEPVPPGDDDWLDEPDNPDRPSDSVPTSEEEEINGPDNPLPWEEKTGARPEGGKRISAIAVKQMIAAAGKAGKNESDVLAILGSHGYEDPSEVLAKDYNNVMAEIRRQL